MGFPSPPDDAAELAQQRKLPRRAFTERVARRTSVLWIRVRGHDVRDEARIESLLARLAVRCAPTTAKVAQRSAGPDALSLKRAGGDGRRDQDHLYRSTFMAHLARLADDSLARFPPLTRALGKTARGRARPRGSGGSP